MMGESVVMCSVVRNRWCEIGEWVPNRRNRWCEIGKSVNGLWSQQFFWCFSGVVGGWVVGSVVFLVVMAATIFLVVVFFFFFLIL